MPSSEKKTPADMGKSKKKGTQQAPVMGENSQATHSDKHTDDEFIEGVDDQDDNVRAQLPSQEHCTWLLNIIQIHARKIARELLDDHEKTVLTPLRQEINNLTEENKKAKLELSECHTEISKLKWSRDGINKELAKKTADLEILKHQLDSMDQKQRETRVRVTGILEEEGENLTKKLVKLAKNKMGLKKIKDTDIVCIHRSGKKKLAKTRDIIVQFDNKTTRDSFHDARRKLQDSSDAHKNIYVNDDLTAFRSKLLYDARVLVHKRKLKGAWSQSGNIMVLRENEKPCAIYSHSDLRKSSGLDFYVDIDSEHLENDGLDSASYSTC